MHKQKPSLLIALCSICLMLAVIFSSCNNDAEKTDAPAKDTVPTTMGPDTSKMVPLPADTMPAVMDSMPKKDSLKKGGIKPVSPKP